MSTPSDDDHEDEARRLAEEFIRSRPDPEYDATIIESALFGKWEVVDMSDTPEITVTEEALREAVWRALVGNYNLHPVGAHFVVDEVVDEIFASLREIAERDT